MADDAHGTGSAGSAARHGPARPVDRVIGGYLIISAAALLFPHRPAAWPLLLIAHLALATFLLAGGTEGIRRPGRRPTQDGEPARDRGLSRAVAAVGDWYPLLLLPLLYWELPILAHSLWDGRFFDPVVLGWEESLFGGQPSATLARHWHSRIVSEILHGAYLGYYPALYLLPLALYARGAKAAFRATVFALMLGFAAHYLVFIVFPVQGPRYLFPGPDGALAQGALYRLTRSILESGSSQGAAFPSSHAAMALVQTVSAFRFLPAATLPLALVTAGISVGAVYGGFHYGVDIGVGLLTGSIVALLAPSARRALC